MKRIEDDRSLFYNLLDFTRKAGGDKGGSVEDMFGGEGTELDGICKEYALYSARKNARNDKKSDKDLEKEVQDKIRIPSRSAFGRHRKQMRECPDTIPAKTAGNYENILNALFWKNCITPIEKCKDENVKKENHNILRRNITKVFGISRDFCEGDEEIIYRLCEGNLVSYIHKISHVALFPNEMAEIRKAVEQTQSAADHAECNCKVMTLIISSNDMPQSLRFRENAKQLERAVIQSMGEESLKLPVFSCPAKDKKVVQRIENTIKNSSYVFFVLGDTSDSGMNSLIRYTARCADIFEMKPVVYVNPEKGGITERDILSADYDGAIQQREYSRECEILFEIARVFLTCGLKDIPKAEMHSEILLLNGIQAVDLSNHPMFSTDTLFLLRKRLAEINEQYDCLRIEDDNNTGLMEELDARRSVIVTRIRQCENIICDCQMSIIGIEQTGSVLDDLNTQVESYVNGGRYEDAVLLLNKADWKEEYESAVVHKAKADAVIKAYIKSRRYLIASMRILAEDEQISEIIDIYENIREASRGTEEYEDIVYEYISFLKDTGRYTQAQSLIRSEENREKNGFLIRDYRFLYVAGEICFKMGNNTDAVEYFRQAAVMSSPDNRIDYIELHVGIAKCLWKAKQYNLMRDTLKDIEKFVSQTDLQTPRGRRIVSSMYRYMGIYESNCFNISKALKLAQKALDIYRPLYESGHGDRIQETEVKQGYAIILNNISVLYKRLGNYEKAADYAEKVLEIHKICTKINPAVSLPEIIKACRNYSIVLRKQERYEISMTVMNEAMTMLDGLPFDNDIERRLRVSCLAELGNLNLDLGKYRDAVEYYKKAAARLDETIEGDKFMYDVFYAENCYDFGRIYRRMGEINKSENKLLEAAGIWSGYAEESTGKYTVLLAQAYAELARTCRKNRKKAAGYQEKSDKLLERFGVSARKYAVHKVEESLLP